MTLHRSRSSTQAPVQVPVVAIDRGGMLTTLDGSAVRVLELTPRAPATMAQLEHERFADGLAAVLDGMRPGEHLQWYVESGPARVRADGAGLPAVRLELARADDRALLGRVLDARPVEQTLALVLREPAGRRRLRRRGEQERLTERSLERADRMRAALAALGLRPRMLDGAGVTRLLLRRLHSGASPASKPRVEVAGALAARHDREQARSAAEQVLSRLRETTIEFADEGIVRIGGDLEQTLYLSTTEPDAAFGWLRALRSVSAAFVLNVHVQRRDDGGLGLSIFCTIREPGPHADPVRLANAVDAAVREAAAATGARFDRGEFLQPALWPSTLPLGRDEARIDHRVRSHAAATAVPVLDDRCGSPDGVVLAQGPRATVERLDPWDPVHRHAAVLIAGTEEPRAATTLATIGRLAVSGARVVVVDLDGTVTTGAGSLGDAATMTTVSAPEALLAVDTFGDRIVVLDAESASDALAVVGAAAGLLAESRQDAPDARGALVIAGAERLLEEEYGARWLARAASQARRCGECLLLSVRRLAPVARAGLLGVLPVRVLLCHDAEDIAEVSELIGLTDGEAEALAELDEGAALWLNGDRGRSVVRLIPLIDREPVA